jgi:YtcA family
MVAEYPAGDSKPSLKDRRPPWPASVILSRSNLAGRRLTLLLPGASLAGCDPVVSVAGANFPVWLLCLIAGILIALGLRPLFIAAGIDEGMTPRPLIYSCLALTVAFICWLLLWGK